LYRIHDHDSCRHFIWFFTFSSYFCRRFLSLNNYFLDYWERLSESQTILLLVLISLNYSKVCQFRYWRFPLLIVQVKTKNDRIRKCKDNNNSKSKYSLKTICWGSLDLYPGVETIFTVMDSNDSKSSLIVSLSLCNSKKMFQLSNLNLEDVSNLFWLIGLGDYAF
jgi:hypothetical protein